MYFVDILTTQVVIFLKQFKNIKKQSNENIKKQWETFFENSELADPNKTPTEFYTERLKIKKGSRLEFMDVYFSYAEKNEIPKEAQDTFFKSLIYVASDLGSELIDIVLKGAKNE